MTGKGLFITGAGTEVGKTLIACALAHQLCARGHPVNVLKPVISGFDADAPEGSDTALLLSAMGVPVTEASLAATSPWRYAAAISPNMAAAREGNTIDMAALDDFCRAGLAENRFTLIEGVGGVMAPLTDTATVLDWMKGINLPTVLVTGSYLGAISHALTAAAVLARNAVTLNGVVVSCSEDNPVPVEETCAAISGFLPGLPVIAVPRISQKINPWEAVPDLTALASA